METKKYVLIFLLTFLLVTMLCVVTLPGMLYVPQDDAERRGGHFYAGA